VSTTENTILVDHHFRLESDVPFRMLGAAVWDGPHRLTLGRFMAVLEAESPVVAARPMAWTTLVADFYLFAFNGGRWTLRVGVEGFDYGGGRAKREGSCFVDVPDVSSGAARRAFRRACWEVEAMMAGADTVPEELREFPAEWAKLSRDVFDSDKRNPSRGIALRWSADVPAFHRTPADDK
jgi:hypothetical protein